MSDVKKIQVYFMPGLAASSTIFERISLPRDRFEMHLLEWEIPLLHETIAEYAKRMTAKIDKKSKLVLVGVSFGGIMVQEMSRFCHPIKTIVISSVLHQSDYPKRMKFMRKTKLYKFIPTYWVQDVERLAKYAFGEVIKERIELYKKYLSVTDKKYLDWAIKELLHWEQEQQLSNVIHIHGGADKVFPVSCIKNDFVELKNGTHIVIINRYKWFNENLPRLIMA